MGKTKDKRKLFDPGRRYWARLAWDDLLSLMGNLRRMIWPPSPQVIHDVYWPLSDALDVEVEAATGEAQTEPETWDRWDDIEIIGFLRDEQRGGNDRQGNIAVDRGKIEGPL